MIRNVAIGLGMFVIIAAVAFALPQMMPDRDQETYYPTTADSSIFAEQQPVMVEPMPETVTVVRRPTVVETQVIRRPVTRTRIASRSPHVTLVEKEIDYDHNGNIEKIEYDYDHHRVGNALHRLGHKIFH